MQALFVLPSFKVKKKRITTRKQKLLLVEVQQLISTLLLFGLEDKFSYHCYLTFHYTPLCSLPMIKRTLKEE